MSQTVDVGTPPAPPQDERVAQQVDARPALGSPRDRGAGRRDRHLRHLLHRRPPVPRAQLARHRPLRQLHLRHPGGRGGAADDRRGVRPVGRCRRHRLGAGRVDGQLPAQRQHVRRRRRRPGRRPGDRLHQRLPGGEDGHPQLPGHPGHVLHAAGAQPGRHQDRHRQRRHQRRVATSPASSWPRTSSPPSSPSAASRSGSRCCGGSCSSSSPPGSCSAPTSATGSSPSAAPRPARGRSASRSTR